LTNFETHSNTAGVGALELPSMRYRLLLRKLYFLRRLLKDDVVGVGPELLCACADDLCLLCLVKECVELGMFGCVVVQKLLQGEDIDFIYEESDYAERSQHVHSEV